MFFHWADNYFSRFIEFSFWPTIHCGLVVNGDLPECLYNGSHSCFLTLFIFNIFFKHYFIYDVFIAHRHDI